MIILNLVIAFTNKFCLTCQHVFRKCFLHAFD